MKLFKDGEELDWPSRTRTLGTVRPCTGLAGVMRACHSFQDGKRALVAPFQFSHDTTLIFEFP